MTNYLQYRELFLQDPLSVQLSKLAVNLNRISSDAEPSETVLELVRESQYFVDWMGRSFTLDEREELLLLLLDIMRELSGWKVHWDKTLETDKSLMQSQAKAWAEQVSTHMVQIQNIEAEWIKEVERRIELVEEGKMCVIPGDEAHKMMRRK
jgi:hypothetical protein